MSQPEIEAVLRGESRWCVVQADCLDYLEAVRGVDAVVTDPPYGIGTWSSTGGNSLAKDEVEAINNWDSAPTDEALRRIVGVASIAIVWGGNYFFGALGPCRSPLVWDKRIRGMHFADGEMAWTNFKHGTLRILELPASASDARGNRQHPTQKPVALMGWCLGLAKLPPDAIVFDPFTGSGTTGVAAIQAGHRFIGIEREPSYCAIARRRIADAAAQGSLF